METTLICAGFGGQGVMMAGKIISQTACKTTDKYVTFFPSYGKEMRGGTANCYVVLSDDEIGAPMVNHVNNLMVFNGPSIAKFHSYLEDGGNLFVNTTVVREEDIPKRDDIHIIRVDAGNIALRLGNPRCLNLIMMGAFIGYTGALPESNCMETIIQKLGAKRPELNPVNEAAFQEGLAIGRAARG